ncbi:hypothetical protein Pan97_26970 [Bremerella volcania]|uniref:2-oxoadipate dioxygenase/decarboxylase n=1 Tax=Bremerella volcania TaxID=2527984 RepID=A0A518C8W3_9BACT|nr:DUF1338 domain-containing protein [Bremerella volcania]QDU75663.1 hypothetical protein Pan97_26970 [Bremerella volcania]
MGRSIEKLIDQLWDSYQKINPQADQIHKLLSDRGETIVNDHIAFRTFQDPRIGIDQLAIPFLEAGYQPADEYHFETKKLFARHFQHSDPALPKVFISELLLNEFSGELGDIIQRMLEQLPEMESLSEPLCTAGRLWEVPFAHYETLSEQSEYAAWMAAHGFCANHFTIFVNALKTIDSLQDLNSLLVQEGFALNQEGGAIKGSPEVYLEQSSTIASVVDVRFADGVHAVPGCYYEFARRYPLPNGSLFEGFVAKSADKIFESTDKKLQN